MVREVSNNFIADKNAETNRPIWLYSVDLDGTGANMLYLAEYDRDVTYYRRNGTGWASQSYMAFPMTHGGVGENNQSRVDQLQITMGNVTREIQALMEQYDGLRRCKVEVVQVFYDHLSDPLACIRDIYYVDTSTSNVKAATFLLTSKLDVMNQRVPCHWYRRNFCRHTYKGRGCWPSDGSGGFTEPANFSKTNYNICIPESVPSAWDGSSQSPATATLTGRGAIVSCPLTMTVDIYLSAILNGIGGNLLPGDSTNLMLYDSDMVNGLVLSDFWDYVLPYAGGPAVGWKTYAFPADGFGLIDPDGWYNNVALIQLNITPSYSTPPAAGAGLVAKFRNMRMLYGDWVGSVFTPSTDSPCDKTFDSCLRHSNESRYGGFPNIPTNGSVFRVG